MCLKIKKAMKISLSEGDVNDCREHARKLCAQAESMGFHPILFVPGKDPVELTTIDVASRLATHIALGEAFHYELFKTRHDPDLVWQGRTWDVKSSVFGDLLKVPQWQAFHFEGYFYAHQLDGTLREWDIVGYISLETFVRKAYLETFHANKRPMWVVPVSELTSLD